ncbi:MAG TPA: phosphatidate cytidylyltransferase [Patescibacteria group bacterium]|nr:phosphatidate cytidylyltransferase [Patescibacteria group bacterium]
MSRLIVKLKDKDSFVNKLKIGLALGLGVIFSVIYLRMIAVIGWIVVFGTGATYEYVRLLAPKIAKNMTLSNSRNILFERIFDWKSNLVFGGTFIFAPLLLLAMIIGRSGWPWAIFIAGNCYLTDAGGAIFGKFIAPRWKGNLHKINEKISPKKSWEALVFGGVTLALAGCAIIYFVMQYFHVPKTLIPSPFWLFVVIPIGSGFATIGDMAESFIKRLADVKDSSRVLGTHGGFFDRTDSLLGISYVYIAIYILRTFNKI